MKKKYTVLRFQFPYPFLFKPCFKLLVCCGLLFPEILLAQTCGWNAHPEAIRDREENRPDFIWQEHQIPAYTLPEVLLNSDGSLVDSKDQWPLRRKEILELFRKHVYGYRPGAPEQLTFHTLPYEPNAMQGRASGYRILIRSEHSGREHEFELLIFLPNGMDKPVPVFLLMNNRDPENTDPTRGHRSGFWPAEEVIERGYGIAAIQNKDLAPDDTERYIEGIIRLFEGPQASLQRPPDAWRALAAWGWGASRAMDFFQTHESIDASRIALIGHSRGGKAALWAGAEDERFALVISNESGAGGAALSRRRYGETVRAVNRFNHWFNDNFLLFNDREDDLPVDQHMLVSLIAPRAVAIGSADRDLWADPRGEYLSLAHSSKVYALWNHAPVCPDRMPSLDSPVIHGPRAYHIRSGSHNLTPQDWHIYMDFADTLWPVRPK